MKNRARIQLISLMLIVFSSFCVAQSGTWTELKPKNSPPGRTAFGMSSIGDGKIIIFGGHNDSLGNLGDTWIYDLPTNSWNEILCDIKPANRESISLAQLSENKVLLFGGVNDEEFSDTWIFDLDSMKWFEMFPKNSPYYPMEPGREDYALASFDKNKVILYGGTYIHTFSDTWIYDLDSNNWTFVWSEVKPGSLQGTQMTNLNNGRAFLFGGWNNIENNKTWIFDSFNQSKYKWREITPKNSPGVISNCGLNKINDSYILLWGVFDHNFVYKKETWLYSIFDSNWVQLDIKIEPSNGFYPKLSKISNNKAVLFGGLNFVSSNELWLFELNTTDVYETQSTNTLISPNPASDYIEISLDSPSIKRGLGGVSLEIFNIFGESLTTTPLFGHPFELEGEKIKIDVSNLSPGVYFIKFGDKFEKFIKW